MYVYTHGAAHAHMYTCVYIYIYIGGLLRGCHPLMESQVEKEIEHETGTGFTQGSRTAIVCFIKSLYKHGIGYLK